ncbi:Na+/H+ antiporter NhaA [Gordonia humi]|uniref:Na(+)/H(+) antiporter NhaA n=1 Tax=Gordonia humi TaxID=686429 RepID=A0A840F1Q8_9ACTN|nr:Na+/H+ antiporter NhaA [Gordonia humi]MBB4137812.1 NhaA family Na+:H+ antiporter [Gordonia humi]
MSHTETAEKYRVVDLLRRETVGGFLLVGAALVAIVVANTPAVDAYETFRDTTVGYAPWHLDLTIGQWASDGLLAIFFFLVGLELNREIVAGSLRAARTAIVPVFAAVGGVVVPALIYLGINWGRDGAHGWAVPTATDIAFAVAVLAVVGKGLPAALRLFLLTLAVVDDLIAIVIIAVVYTESVKPIPLVAALIPIALFAVLARRYAEWFARRRWAAWVILLPLGIVAWALVHASGIHATIAGVVLGFMVPVRTGGNGLAEEFEHRFRPISSGFAVPVFAFLSAGVAVGGWNGLGDMMTDPIAIGVMAGLILGKPIGIMAATWLTVRFTDSELDPSVRWGDLAGVASLAGIGFTVSLLVAELSFPGDLHALEHGKAAILVASLFVAIVAGSALAVMGRRRQARALPRNAT